MELTTLSNRIFIRLLLSIGCLLPSYFGIAYLVLLFFLTSSFQISVAFYLLLSNVLDRNQEIKNLIFMKKRSERSYWFENNKRYDGGKIGGDDRKGDNGTNKEKVGLLNESNGDDEEEEEKEFKGKEVGEEGGKEALKKREIEQLKLIEEIEKESESKKVNVIPQFINLFGRKFSSLEYGVYMPIAFEILSIVLLLVFIIIRITFELVFPTFSTFQNFGLVIGMFNYIFWFEKKIYLILF